MCKGESIMIKFKRFLSVILAMTIAFSLSAAIPAGVVSAAEVVKSGTCGGDNLFYTLDSDGLLTIKGTGYVYSGSFKAWRDVINVVIDGTGVTAIGSRAFMDCSSLKTVALSSGITKIDQDAFCSCYYLENITIYKTVTIIGSGAFFQCTKLKEVFYEGSEEDWSKVTINSDNNPLKNAKIHFNYDPEHEHNWDAGKITKNATCVEKGEITYTCTICGDIKKEELPRGAHKWDAGIVNAGATYTSPGEMLYTCTVCEAIKREPIPKLKAPTVAQITGLKTTKQTAKAITLKWNSAKNADKYLVYRSKNGSEWTKVGSTKNLTYTDKDLKAGAKYQYKVRGYHTASKATGKYSTVLKTGTLTSAPKITKLTSTKSKTATVTWSKVTGAKSYIVKYTTDGKTWTTKNNVTGTSLTISKLAGGKKLQVKIYAVNAYGKNSTASAVKSVTVKK